MNERLPGDLKKQYILVVDSDVDERYRTSRLLERFGFHTFTVAAGAEAAEFISAAPVLAVVTEGGLTGASILNRMKTSTVFSNVPVILLSPSVDRELEEAIKQGQVAVCLRKPIDVEEFFRVLHQTIGHSTRRNLRIATALKASITGRPSATQEYITALSEYGMFVRTLETQPLNTRLSVNVEISERPLTIEAAVLYVSSFYDGPSKEPGMGLKFVDIDRETRTLVRKFILAQLGVA